MATYVQIDGEFSLLAVCTLALNTLAVSGSGSVPNPLLAFFYVTLYCPALTYNFLSH